MQVPLLRIVGCIGVIWLLGGAAPRPQPRIGIEPAPPALTRRFTPIRIKTSPLAALQITVPGDRPGEGGVAGSCPPVVTTLSSFDFVQADTHIQAGFAEHEIAAASYVLTAADFPLVIERVEVVFGQSHTNPTTTQFSIIIWQGIPSTGTIVGQVQSDGTTIPHIHLPAGGSTSVNVTVEFPLTGPGHVQVADNPAHTFSVGFRIDHHQAQGGPFPLIPCLLGPPLSQNAFPTTDIDPAPNPDAPANNWLFAVDCSALGGLSGWYRFSQLPSGAQPSGDWIIRTTRRPTTCAEPTGGCCLPAGRCSVLTQSGCESASGIFLGAGALCAFCEPFDPVDLNHDGVVNSLDLGILLSAWSTPPGAPGCGGAPGACASDLNHDGQVDTLDLGILLADWTL